MNETYKPAEENREAGKPRKRRALTAANVLDRKPGRVLTTGSDEINALLGVNPEARGMWLVYGREKNGKTTFALQLARAVAEGGERVLYVSAEEGCRGTFAAALRRSGLTRGTRNVAFEEYVTLDELTEAYRSPQKQRVIIIDNVKAYETELRSPSRMAELCGAMKNKLLVFVAHERENRPYPRAAEDIRLFADVVVHVRGLVAAVVSRYEGGGGEYVISDAAEKYRGGGILRESGESLNDI